MTTITIEDILQALDENPQLTEELSARLITPQAIIKAMDKDEHLTERMRERLLTRELLDLPKTFAAFAEATNRRFDKIEGDIAEIRGDIKDIREDIVEIRADMGEVKGGHARTYAVRRAFSIARSVGLHQPKVLTDEDIWNITEAADTSAIPANDLHSFREADLIMEAQDDEGRTCHVAVEISYTLAGNDTSRAIRNAQYLSDFTRNPAHAVVAGRRANDRAQSDIDSGKATWFRLRPRDLAAD